MADIKDLIGTDKLERYINEPILPKKKVGTNCASLVDDMTS